MATVPFIQSSCDRWPIGRAVTWAAAPRRTPRPAPRPPPHRTSRDTRRGPTDSPRPPLGSSRRSAASGAAPPAAAGNWAEPCPTDGPTSPTRTRKSACRCPASDPWLHTLWTLRLFRLLLHRPLRLCRLCRLFRVLHRLLRLFCRLLRLLHRLLGPLHHRFHSTAPSEGEGSDRSAPDSVGAAADCRVQRPTTAAVDAVERGRGLGLRTHRGRRERHGPAVPPWVRWLYLRLSPTLMCPEICANSEACRMLINVNESGI